jgi:hypothetical protein
MATGTLKRIDFTQLGSFKNPNKPTNTATKTPVIKELITIDLKFLKGYIRKGKYHAKSFPH